MTVYLEGLFVNSGCVLFGEAGFDYDIKALTSLLFLDGNILELLVGLNLTAACRKEGPMLLRFFIDEEEEGGAA